jgi:hypothetical protein
VADSGGREKFEVAVDGNAQTIDFYTHTNER